MRTRTITMTAALLLALTACADSGDTVSAKPSATAEKATATPASVEPAAPEDSAAAELAEAEEEFEQTLKDLENSMGETLGIQEGTYEVTNSQPDYEDPLLALDDEYLVPGTYTTKGPADGSSGCYWARMQDASGQSITANDLTTGRALVSLEEGEFFKTSGCKPWTKSGN